MIVDVKRRRKMLWNSTPTLQCLRSVLRAGATSQSNSPNSKSECSGACSGSGRVCSQEVTSGIHPSWDGSMYIIPQRLTVAGCERAAEVERKKNFTIMHSRGAVRTGLWVWPTSKRKSHRGLINCTHWGLWEVHGLKDETHLARHLNNFPTHETELQRRERQ